MLCVVHTFDPSTREVEKPCSNKNKNNTQTNKNNPKTQQTLGPRLENRKQHSRN